MEQLKSLGQVFLQDTKYLQDILFAAQICVGDYVLEIGPGQGILTQSLVKAGAKVLAIEKDPRFVEYLQEHIHNQNFKVIQGDIRDIYLDIIQKQHNPFKIVANIPYYLTSFLLRMILENNPKPEICVFLVQQEVAERLVTKNNKESILSLLIKYYADVFYIKKVPRQAFNPIPKIDSAIVKIIPRKDIILDKEFTNKLFKIIKIGFSSPRKYVLSNFKNGFVQDKDIFIKIFRELNISLQARAEDISLDQWKQIANHILNKDKGY